MKMRCLELSVDGRRIGNLNVVVAVVVVVFAVVVVVGVVVVVVVVFVIGGGVFAVVVYVFLLFLFVILSLLSYTLTTSYTFCCHLKMVTSTHSCYIYIQEFQFKI